MNMIYHTFDWFYRKYVFMKNENSRVGKVFPENKWQLELLEESDLVLINRDFAFDDALALPPNVVPVGGLQVERSNEIPNDVRLMLYNCLISCDDFFFSSGCFHLRQEFRQTDYSLHDGQQHPRRGLGERENLRDNERL